VQVGDQREEAGVAGLAVCPDQTGDDRAPIDRQCARPSKSHIASAPPLPTFQISGNMKSPVCWTIPKAGLAK